MSNYQFRRKLRYSYLIVILCSLVPWNVEGRFSRHVVRRTVAYEKVLENKHFKCELMQTKTTSSSNLCLIACLSDKSCRSFNFRGRLTCEPCSDDIFSIANGEQLLQDDPKCKYVAMEKEEVPQCFEGETKIDIQEDHDNGRCRINNTRVDIIFGPWKTEPTIDTVSEWKEYQTRPVLLEAAHGGKVSGDLTRIIQWYRFVRILKNWNSAQAHCVSLGGKLFSRVDGTTSQLDFFIRKMGNQPHWFGIYTEDHTTWKDIDGQVIPSSLLRFRTGQPDNFLGIQNHVQNYYVEIEREVIKYLDDNNLEAALSFVCEMNHNYL